MFDVTVMMVFGLLGYLFQKFEYEAAPLMLAFVLGPMFEINLRQSLMVAGGSFLIFLTRPISAFLVVASLVIIASSFSSYFRKTKDTYETTTRDD